MLTCIGIAAVWLGIAWDGRLHWDEAWYLYAGGYSVGDVLAGEFEPTRIEGFTFQRVGHILAIRLLTALVGPGMAALWLLIACYLAFLIAFAWVTYRILRTLTPSVNAVATAVALLIFSPLYLYLGFKTLPEIPALLAASVSVFTLLRSLTGRAVIWLTLTALALLVIGLFRPAMGVMFLSCIAALALCYGNKLPLLKLIGYALLSGLGSLALFVLALGVMGIPLHAYLAFVRNALSMREPLVSVIFHTALEGGLLFMALPLAFVSAQKRAAALYAVWFILATLPILILFQKIESRYLASNLIALAGLISLSIDGLAPRIYSWWSYRRTVTIIASGVIAAVLIASAVLAQRIMTHGVHMHQVDGLLRTLDQTYGQGGYAILTPDVFATFHYLRFVYPERKVYTVHRWRNRVTGEVDPHWPLVQKRFYGPRAILTIDELATLDDRLVYLAFRESFPVANLRAMVDWLSWTPLPRFTHRALDKMSLMNHFEESWMWGHPQLKFSEVAKSGHYVAMRIEISLPGATVSTQPR